VTRRRGSYVKGKLLRLVEAVMRFIFHKVLFPYFEILFVSGDSMLPTYKDGDIICVFKFIKPNKMDVALVNNPRVQEHYPVVKRVTGELRRGNKRDLVFLLGDNPDKSYDSRHYGWIPESSIIGKVFPNRKNHERGQQHDKDSES
jgi:signal peptidase I